MLANMKGLLLGMALAATIPTLDKASAQSIETGTGLLCDQPSEVERFFSLLEDDLQTAIEQVNAEAHKASACAVVQVAFVKGNEVAAGRHKNGSYKVVEVVVVAIFNDQWLSVTPRPAVQSPSMARRRRTPDAPARSSSKFEIRLGEWQDTPPGIFLCAVL